VSAGAERVLTQRELNRALLERQFLLSRRRESLPRALERLAGIQAQYAPSMYIGLWSRLADFERDLLTRALERRTVVQATLMRSTIHLVSARDYWPFAVGTRDARRESWRRAYRRGPTPDEMLAAARRLERKLADGPRTRAELLDGIDAPRFGGASTRLNLVRVPPSGTWERRRADLFGRAEDWIGPAPPISAAEGIDLLVKKPQSETTFTVDGSVAGTCRQDGRRVRLEPFGRLRREDREELEAEAARLADYVVL
jgi:hypothetical protein